MFRKKVVLLTGLALIANHALFAQVVDIDTAISNAARAIAAGVPDGARIAITHIQSESEALSEYIISRLFSRLHEHSAQVLSWGAVQVEAARLAISIGSELVTLEDQISLGRGLGVDTIVTGQILRMGTNFHLTLQAFDSLSLLAQAAPPGELIEIDSRMRALIGETGAVVPAAPVAAVHVEDFTVGERLRMGAFNMFFGAGSIANRQHLGWAVAGGQSIGLLITILGATWYIDPYFYDEDRETQRTLLMAGGGIIGAAIVFGYIIPFFHTRPTPVASGSSFPFSFELASSNNRDINGLRISYTMRF